MSLFASGLRWGEAPRWHEGALWVADTQGSTLYTGTTTRWRGIPLPTPANGLWFQPDGTLVAALMHKRQVAVLRGEVFEPFVDLAPLGVTSLGDMIGDGVGTLYVDDVVHPSPEDDRVAHGRLIRITADGTASVAATHLEFPNGLALLDGGRTLVVAETTAQRLTAFEVALDGTLGSRRLYADLRSLVGPDASPDGIWAVGEDGLWVATTAAHQVVLLRDGAVVDSLEFSGDFPIACCVGDQTLYVTIASTGGRPLIDALLDKTVETRVESFDLTRRGSS